MAEKKPYSGTKTVWVASDYGNLTRAGELKNLADLQSSIPAQSELPGISTINTPNLTGGVTIKPTPALNQTARQILADPKAFVERSPATPGNVGFLDRGKDLLGRIFDYEDKADLSVGPVNLSGVESVWDGFLRSFDWFYDRINQLGTAAISALPGGTRTLTYKEAGEVSFGQQFVANAGVSAGRIRRGEGNLGDLTAVASLPGLAAFLAPDSAIQQPGFDITSEEDRKAFDSGYEKFFSGLTDTFYTVFADPLIVGGKAAKVTKLRYLTKPLNSPARQKEFVDNLDRGIEAYTQNNVPLEQVSPEAQFLIWSVGGDGVGRARTAQEMLKRAEIQDLGMEGVTTALALMPRTRFANGVFEAVPQAELLQQGRDLLAAPFDAAAKARVQQAIPASLLALANAERMKIALQLRSDPTLLAGKLHDYTKMRDDAFDVYQALIDDNKKLLDDFADPNIAAGSIRGGTTASQIENARLRYENLDATVKALENGTLPDPASFRASYDDVEKALDQLIDQNDSLRAAIEGASRVTVTDSYGFAADNRFGRFVTQRRAKRAQANYEYQATYASKEVDSVDFFGNSRFVNTVRVWRWPGTLRPSGYLVTDGANDVDGITEVESLLNSLRALAGKPKEVQVQAKKYNERTRAYDPVFDADGKPVMETLMVGGVPAKERLMAEFMRNYSLNQNMAGAAYTLERSLKDELARFYDVNESTMEMVIRKATKEREETAANLVDKNRKFFAEPEVNSDLYVLNLAPHLKGQLMNGMYMLPFDALEKVLLRVEKRARKGDPDISSAIFNWQTNVAETGGAFLNNFYDFWRPAVLFRLGYPQRNVGEGDFRSMAFFASVAPLAWTAKGMAYGATNFGRAKRVERQLEKLKEQIGRPDVTRDKFDELMVKQDALRREQMRLVRKAQEYQSPNFELPDSFSLENSLGEAVTEFGLPAFKTADNTIVIYKDETGAWGVREKRIVDGEELLVDVEGLPLTFRSEITAQRAFETLMNDMIRSIKDTGQPNKQARAFMAIEGSYIGEFLRKGVEVTPKPIEIDAGVIGGGQKAQTFGEVAAAVAGKTPIAESETLTLSSLSEVEDAIRQLDNQINDLDTQMDQFGGRPISAALKNTKFQKWRANQMAALEQQIDEAEQWIKNAREDSRSIDLDTNQQATLVFLNDQIRTLRNQQRVLERDDVYALSEYGRQAAAKRRVDHGGSVAFTPGVTLHSAFGDPRYADIAWSNMSSDNTIKATLSLRLQFYDSLFYKKDFETYREVTPDMGDRYWEGMADYLQQYHYDPVGQKILEGQSVRDIAVWMLGSDEGRALRDSLDAINRVRNTGPGVTPVNLIGNSMDNAEAWVSRIANALYRVTLNNAAITEALKRGPVDAAFLKQQIGDSAGLFPVVGHVDEISGRKSFMEFWRTMTSKTFHAIGTLPEDSLVRGPFYAKRYDQARKQLMEMLAAKYGNDLDKVPLDEALELRMRAHRTALRDTKKYLYTIDRRTNLATYGEHVFPFITATQNSVTTLGRLTYKDPSIPGILLALWSAPTRVGWEDEQGNIRIPLPEQLIPDGVERFFGIEGFKNILVNKDSLNVIFPESGFGFVPRPTPLVQVAASELMKNGFFGMFSVEAPDLLVKFAGKKDADTIWKYWKNYIFGEESAISPEFLSYDKITPPTLNRIIQLIQGDTSNQYAYQYGLQARTMDLMWRAGQLENYPTAEEVAARTNGMFFLRWLGNAFAFTPPTYESPVDQLIQMQRQYDQVYGILGPQKFSENFGNETLILANTETAQNVGGTTVTVDTVRNINRYEGLLGELAPTLGTDLGVLGILVNPDPGESEYDTNAYRWMTTTNIPGTSRKWRELNTGQEAVQEAQRQAGWVEYIKFKNSLDALLQQRGLSSYRVKAAADLNLMRKQFEENMLNNPLYDGWKQDFMTPGSTKTMSALKVIGRALQDETFMADHQDDKTWWMATQYMAARQQVVDYIKASGKSASDPVNEQVLLEWDAFRQDLMNQDIGWASLSNRYLLSDDVPEDFGTSFLEG